MTPDDTNPNRPNSGGPIPDGPDPDGSGTETPARKRGWGWRHVARVAAVAAIVAVIVVGGLLWYASTARFAEQVHRTLVATLERATGGRVEIDSFHWSVRHLSIDVDGLTIHGTEAAGQTPYFHVDHLALRAKIITFFRPKISLVSLQAEKPTLHLILNPDGTTNQPRPRTTGNTPLPQTLLNLAIGSTRVENGLVLLNDRRVPWEMASGPLELVMRYVPTGDRYEAEVETKNLTFKLKNATEAHSQLQARVSLTRDAFRIENLELKTGHSGLTATGELQNFAHPRWQMAVRGTVEAREVGAITGLDALQDGVAQLRIDAQGAPTTGGGTSESFQVAGHVDMRSAAWEAPWLRLQKMEVHTNLLIDNDQCAFTGISAVLEDGGRIDGSLVLRHCVGPSAPVFSAASRREREASAGRSTLEERASRYMKLSPRELLRRLHRTRSAHPVKEREGAVYRPLEANLRVHVAAVTLPLILAATAPQKDSNIGFTTATSGDVTAHWTGDGRDLDVHGDLTMQAPKRLLGLIPVTGTAHADYLGDHRHLVIQRADEYTPGTEVHASGTLTLLDGDKNSNLRLDVVGRDLGEFDQLLTMLDLRVGPRRDPDALPVKLLGNASFHGNIHGSFFALEAVGHLDSGRFEMLVSKPSPDRDRAEERTGARAGDAAVNPAGQAPPVHRLGWDAFHAEVAYAPARLVVRNAELVRGETTIFAGLDLRPDRTGPDSYTYDRRTHIFATVASRNASIADLQSMMGTSYPASGHLTVNGHVNGIVDDLTGDGQVVLLDGMAGGQKIRQASVRMTAHGHAVEVTEMRVAAAGGSARGHAVYDYESGALAGTLTGENFQLEKVASVRGRQIGGKLGFSAQASGTASAPVADATVQIEKMTMDRRPMGRLDAKAHLERDMLYLRANAAVFSGHLDATGQVRLRGDDPAEAQLAMTGFDVGPLLAMAAPSLPDASSSIDGRVTLAGPLRQLAALRADANLKAFSIRFGQRQIHSEGPVEASMRDGMLRLLQPVRLQGQDVDLVADGTVDLMRGNRLRLHTEGSIDAGIASSFYSGIQSSGHIQFTVNVRGTAAEPDLRGRAQVSHVNLHMANVTNGMTDMNGEMVFDQDRMVIEKLEGSSGGGQLEMTGSVGYRNGIFADLTTTAKGVRIRYPRGISSSVDAKLRLLGTSDSMLLSGKAELMRFDVGSTVDLAALAGSGGVSAPVDPLSPLNRVRLDVHVTSAPELGFQNSFASLAGDVNLRVRGTLENPSVLGRIDITEGTASFAGTTYHLQQGDILFTNPVTISPQIDLEATARVQNYDIIIGLHGPPSKLDISYRSEPPLTQADVLALLALGRTNEQATMYGEQQQAGANLTTEALLGGALNAAVSSRVQKLFGVGSVRVDPNFVGTLGESTARVTVEEQVGRSVTLTFATNVNTTAQQLIQAQWDLNRTMSIIAVRDEADVFSMYLQIRGKHK